MTIQSQVLRDVDVEICGDGELKSFFEAVEQLGARRADFDCYYSPEQAGDGREIVELTYRPAGLTRWYDVRLPRWQVFAVDDFRRGRFDR